METNLKIGALFQRESAGTWLGFCPSVRGAFAQGDSLDECRERLGAAIASMLRYAPTDDVEDLMESQVDEVSAELLEVPLPERSESKELVGQSAIARLAGVTRQAVNRWVRERKDFPAAAGRSASGPVWRQDDVLKWLVAASRNPGRPPKEVSPWRHEGHMDVALVCKLHLRETADTDRLITSLVSRLESVTQRLPVTETEIFPIGTLHDSR